MTSTTKRPFCPVIGDTCKRECIFRDLHGTANNCSVLQFFEDTHTIATELNTHSISQGLTDIKTALQYLR